MWPIGKHEVDGVRFYWPDGVDKDDKLETFKKLFRDLGYEECDNANFEKGYRKIALYKDNNESCTHAARQRRNGLWTSKLGKDHDIDHGGPESIEGDIYGNVACIMKKAMS